MENEIKMPNKFTLFFKRFFDVVLSGTAIILLLPFFMFFTPLVALIMKGNPFFIQKRVGKDEKVFKLIKFRTMTNKKDKEGNLLSDAERLTKFGKVMRKLSIDELPELFNIFLGEMSIVGPRPLNTVYLPFYSETQKLRHSVRPGLTGLAQISGRNNAPWNIRFSYDLEYISKCSLIYDLKIIFRTLIKVIKRADIVVLGDNTIGDFYDEYCMSECQQNKEIGGPFIFGNDLEKGNGLQIKTDKANSLFVNSGRNAITLVLESVKAKKAYLPSFTCNSVIDQFIRQGIEIEFYQVDKKLHIANDLVKRIKKENAVVFLQSYFGNYELDDVKKKLKKIKNITVIEDITHSLLKDGKFQNADFYVASLRKWGGFGEGGFVAADNFKPTLKPNNLEILNLVENASVLQKDYLEKNDKDLKTEFRAILANVEELYEEIPVTALSEKAEHLYNETDFEDIKNKRKENYNTLYNLFSEFSAVQAVYSPKEICGAPLFFSIYVLENRDEMQKYFINNGAYVPIIWPKPTCVDGKTDGTTDYIYSHILSFPIDQRYSKEDMIKMFKILESYCKQ